MAYVKPYADVFVKIQELERDILGNPRLTIHQKRDKMAWRDALIWAITKDEKAWRRALKEMYSSREYADLKRAQEKAVHAGEPDRKAAQAQ